MLKLRKIAITGGVASGKSTVCRFFQELGAFVVNTDEIVHELLTPETNLGQQVLRLLGNDILINGKLSRRAIADKVFKNQGLLHDLEQLLHPAVLQQIEEIYHAACHKKGITAFVVEIPLLYEIEKKDLFDTVIAVTAPETVCLKRFCKAGFTDKEYTQRMKRQWSPSEKARLADYVIHNDGSLEHVHQQVLALKYLLQTHN